MHRLKFISFTFLIIFSLSSCTTAPTSATQETLSQSTNSSENQIEQVKSISFTDASGQIVCFSTPPQRIAFAGRASQMLLHAAYLFPEAIERIVAMEQRLQTGISMLPLIDAKFEQKIQFERDASAEQIAPVNPEVVVMKTYLAERLGEPLQQLNIPVVYLDMETPDQFLRDIDSLGALFANPTRAQQIQDFYQGQLDQIADTLTNAQAQDRPSVLLIQYDTRSGEIAFNVPPADWLQTTVIELAGGEPVWLEAAEAGGWTVINFEQIAAWNPQMVIVVNYFDDPSLAVAALKQDANWQALRATQTGQIYAFPGDFLSWDQPDSRWILGLQWLVSVIHPQLFPASNLLAEVQSFYQEMYAMDGETFNAQVLPLLSGDIEK